MFDILEPREFLSATTWYVSGSAGQDLDPVQNPNWGQSLGTPFLTINYAAQQAKAGDTVLIRGGTYRETVTPLRSGTSGARITYASYNNENVTISGVNLLSGWTVDSGTVYKASMNSSLGTGLDQLFVDGTMVLSARFPDPVNYTDISHPTKNTIDSVVSNTLSGGIMTSTFRDSSLTQSTGYWNGSLIFIVPGNHTYDEWIGETATVTSYTNDGTTGTITYQTNSGSSFDDTTLYGASVGNRYYLLGGRADITVPGEWYRNSSTKIAYLMCPGDPNPNNHVVEYKARDSGINLSGKSYITIQGLNFFAASVYTNSSSTYDIISNINASYLSHYERTGISAAPNGWSSESNSGIQLNGSHNQLINSEICYCAGNGVSLGGTANTINGCTIHDVDYMATDNAAVFTSGSGHLIQNNTMYNTGRSIIVNRNTPNQQIMYNNLYNGGLQCNDLGGTYTFGGPNAPSGNQTQAGGTSRIAYNYIHDITCNAAGGVYLDNYSQSFLVDHNVTWNVPIGIYLNRSSLDNRVINNTFDSTSKGATTYTQNSSYYHMTGSIVENNIFFKSIADITNSNPGNSDLTISNNVLPGTNPQVVSQSGHNYQLASSTSPAYNAGLAFVDNHVTQSGSAATGVNVTANAIGSPDIGAYEYGAAAWTAGSAPVAPGYVTASANVGKQINLSWAARSSIATGYNIYRGTSSGGEILLASNVSGTTYSDSSGAANTTYYYQVTAVDSFGESARTNEASATTMAPNYGIFASELDVGGATPAGAADQAAGVYTVQGGGADIWGTSDQCHFLYMPLNGNGQIIARVSSLTAVNGNYTKGGVMIRNSLDANAQSAYMVIQYPNNTNNVADLLYRTTTGGTTAYSGSGSASISTPEWVKLVRSGNSFSGYYSRDGVTWTLSSTQSIAMGTLTYIGLAYTSKSTTSLGTATFDNVSVVTLPLAPTALGVTATSATQITVSWTDNSNNETGFKIDRATSSDFTQNLTTLTASSNSTGTASYVDTPGAGNGVYYYRVRATNSVGDSANTAGVAGGIWAATTTPVRYVLQCDPLNSANIQVRVNALSPVTVPASLLQSLYLAGSTGDDTLTIDCTYGNPLPGGGVSFNGKSHTGGDVIVIHNSGNASLLTFSSSQITIGGQQLSFSNVQAIMVDSDLGAGGTMPRLEVSGVVLQVLVSEHWAGLALSNQGKVQVAAGSKALLDIGVLSIDGSSVVDLNDNDLIAHNTAVEVITSWIQTQRLVSSSANGTAGLKGLASIGGDLYLGLNGLGATFHNEKVSDSDALVRYSVRGDANLDGVITMDDYLQIDSGFLFGGSGYAWGDFDYSGQIDARDYALIDTNLAAQGDAQATQMASLHASWFPETYAQAVTQITTPAGSSESSNTSGQKVRHKRTKPQHPTRAHVKHHFPSTHRR